MNNANNDDPFAQTGVFNRQMLSAWQDPKAPTPYDLDKRLTVLEHSNQEIKQELNQINSNINRLVWVIVIAVVTGILNLVLKGPIVGG